MDRQLLNPNALSDRPFFLGDGRTLFLFGLTGRRSSSLSSLTSYFQRHRPKRALPISKNESSWGSFSVPKSAPQVFFSFLHLGTCDPHRPTSFCERSRHDNRGGPAAFARVLDFAVALRVGVVSARRLLPVARATCVVVMRVVSAPFNVVV